MPPASFVALKPRALHRRDALLQNPAEPIFVDLIWPPSSSCFVIIYLDVCFLLFVRLHLSFLICIVFMRLYDSSVDVVVLVYLYPVARLPLRALGPQP